MTGCSAPLDRVLLSLGQYESENYFFAGSFQDFTDYAKYVYNDVDFTGNRYFEKISADTREDLLIHIEDFEERVALVEESELQNEMIDGYDFDVSCITKDDYLYICDDPDYPELGCYDVYFFDMETLTLYYFHNNL